MEKIYEVLRVLDGKPVFLKEHLERLQKSWLFYHKEAMVLDNLEAEIFDLASQKKEPHNLRIEIQIQDGAYTIQAVEGVYPTKAMKDEGVALATFEHQRHNPQVKAIDPELAERAKAFREEKGVYSLLYVHEGEVGECEKANIFFVRDGLLITAKDEDVLLGVTRQKVLEIAQNLNIPVVKRTLRSNELFTMDGVFMSGTSIHVLPVRKIDELTFDAKHPLVVRLSDEMDRMVYHEHDKKERESSLREGIASVRKEAPSMKRLYRSEDGKLAGVCGGIGEYFDIDPSIIRLLWIGFSLMGGSGIIAYFIAALIIPKKNER